MDIRTRNFTGILENLILIKQLYREFVILSQKILLIVTIAFLKIGDSEEKIRINNVFVCFLVCSFFIWLEMRNQPYMNDELNLFSLRSLFVMLLTIFLGVFGSISNNDLLILLLFILLAFINISFIVTMIRKYILLHMIIKKEWKFGKIIDKYHLFFDNGY